ncbi:MAG: ATP-dependent DNA helicase RecG, partial [Bacteroidota bacterium]
KLRIRTMCETNNGFEISEVDLKLRGPGELEGTAQSGVLDLRIADIAKDQLILQQARSAAQLLLDKDPNMSNPTNQTLLNFFTEYTKHSKWGRIA